MITDKNMNRWIIKLFFTKNLLILNLIVSICESYSGTTNLFLQLIYVVGLVSRSRPSRIVRNGRRMKIKKLKFLVLREK